MLSKQTWSNRSDKAGPAVASTGTALSVPPDVENSAEVPRRSTRFHR